MFVTFLFTSYRKKLLDKTPLKPLNNSDMKIINKFLSLFNKRRPVYGSRIFYQRTWLSRQVDEAMYRRAFQVD